MLQIPLAFSWEFKNNGYTECQTYFLQLIVFNVTCVIARY